MGKFLLLFIFNLMWKCSHNNGKNIVEPFRVCKKQLQTLLWMSHCDKIHFVNPVTNLLIVWDDL